MSLIPLQALLQAPLLALLLCLVVPLQALLSFVELNRTGLDKITKKFDKVASYHHMRETMGTRPIFVFERAVAAHPDSTPPDDMLEMV